MLRVITSPPSPRRTALTLAPKPAQPLTLATKVAQSPAPVALTLTQAQPKPAPLALATKPTLTPTPSTTPPTTPLTPATPTSPMTPRQPVALALRPVVQQSVSLTLNMGGVGPVAQPMQRQAGLPTAETYKQYDQRTHVYMKQEMYIGTDERVMREVWVYDSHNGRMVLINMDFVPACERLLLEIISNASDNVGRSRRAGVDPGSIDIIMDNSTISVTNYGLPMPIEIHPKEKIYIPQMVFGSLLTSSNYEVDRHGAGTNGIGAKAANIFSKEFMVIVHDHIRHLKYTQVWNDNMTKCSPPTIIEYHGTTSSVQVVFKMDFVRFGYDLPNGTQGGYPPEVFALYARHAVDLSFNAKTKVTFNGHEFNFINIRDYARLYFGDAVESAIVHYQWPAGTEIIHKKKGYQVARNPAITPEVELIALDTPDEGRHVSFANCLMTHNGGVHVNAAVKAVGDTAVQMVNETILKKLTRQNKGKELDAKDKRAHTITIHDVKPHISVLLSVKVMNPKYEGQTKGTLSGPTPKIDIATDELTSIKNWQLIDRLYAAIEAKQFASNAKTDGKLRRYVRLIKGVDANNAGKAERSRCVLYITEGRSGAGYANKLISLVPGGRDYIGVLPMRGKSLNVMNADRFQIEKNAEIGELKKMLGLVDCPEGDLKKTYYLDPNNFAKLRYGAIMIMADSDVDGLHIIGLILNFFHCRYPSLLARGFVMYYQTPTLRVSKGNRTFKFYTQREYEEWKTATPDYQTWKHKYYKGLGTSDDNEIRDDYITPRVVTCFYDAEAPNAIKLAFDKNLADQRKDWLGRWQPVLGVEEIHMQPISWFINHKLILFSLAAVQRAIPKLTDGLKESHRKILHGTHKKWKVGSKKTTYNETKVAQFAGFVAGHTHYQHGEQILDDVIIGMGQDFTGSNNIPWFYRKGQFGTRFEGGKDASASRYLHTYPERLVGKILRKEDRPILKPIIEEGDEVEPTTYWPVIPMVLVNGAYGIGMGWSSFVPNHDPLVIIQWLRMKLREVADDDLPDVLPWYRGFQGTIKVIDRRRRRKRNAPINTEATQITIVTNEDGTTTLQRTEATTPQRTDVDDDDAIEDEALNEDELEEITETAGSRPLLSMVSLGKFSRDMNGTIIITELPVGRWPLSYHKWLESLVEEKKITGFRDLSVDNNVYFEIYGFTDQANYRTLKLKRTMGMSNMVLLDESSRPVRYDTAYDILEAFYSRRLPVYQERKAYILQKLAEEITTMHHKIHFIQAVINGELHIINRKVAEIHATMARLGIPEEIYQSSRTRNLSEDDITDLMNQITAKEQERVVVEQTSPEQMWLRDLDELEEVYRTVYGVRHQKATLTLVTTPTTPFPDMVNPATGVNATNGLQAIGQQPRRPARARTATTATPPTPDAPTKTILRLVTKTPEELLTTLSPERTVLTLNPTSA